MAARIFSFALDLHVAGKTIKEPRRYFASKAELQKAIQKLQRNRFTGQMTPLVWKEGNWVMALSMLEGMESPGISAKESIRSAFQDAASILAILSDRELLSEEEKTELVEVVSNAFAIAGIDMDLRDHWLHAHYDDDQEPLDPEYKIRQLMGLENTYLPDPDESPI